MLIAVCHLCQPNTLKLFPFQCLWFADIFHAGLCISYFCVTVTTASDRSMLKEERLILACGFRGSQSILLGSMWQQECLAEAVHTLGEPGSRN